MSRRIVGVVGPAGSGKDSVATYLADHHGFTHVSTGDLIRRYIVDHGLGELGRGLERQVAKQLRDENGSDYLVQRALETEGDVVVSGLRAPAEVQAVKQAGGRVMAVTAPQRTRYARTQGRGRHGDTQSFEEFAAVEAAEAASADANMQNVVQVTGMADDTITNDGSLDELHGQVDAVLERL